MATAAARQGDVLIRNCAGASLQCLDAVSHEPIAIVPSVDHAMRIARERGGAVLRENADSRGRLIGSPIPVTPPTIDHTADHVTCLKALHDKWTAERQQLVTVDPERAFHLTEALDDLMTLIRDVEARDAPQKLSLARRQ